MTETKCFRDAFRDQLHELSEQPNISDTIKIYTNHLSFKDLDKTLLVNLKISRSCLQDVRLACCLKINLRYFALFLNIFCFRLSH